MNEDGRKIGWIPGTEPGINRMKFRPTETVLPPEMPPHANNHSMRREGESLKAVSFHSGASGIEHMDMQYEGINPDEMPSGEMHEVTVFDASSLGIAPPGNK